MIVALITALLLFPAADPPTVEEGGLPEEPIEQSLPYLGVGDQYFMEIYKQGVCVEWTATALSVGWPLEEVPRLLRIMYRESRCIPTTCGVTDSPHVRKCRDWGLMQINDYSWKRTIRGLGYKMEDMMIPSKNLEFALWLYNYSKERNGDGWIPWKKG